MHFTLPRMKFILINDESYYAFSYLYTIFFDIIGMAILTN